MRIQSFLAAIIIAVCPHLALADVPQPVSLEPVMHGEAALTIVDPDGATSVYPITMLEELPTYRIETTTPWRADPTQFDGVMLRELLEVNGLAGVDSIKVTAENDYAVTIPRALWDTVPVLVATRANGAPISRRERGPIQFVIGREDFANSDIPNESYLVWMAARIEKYE